MTTKYRTRAAFAAIILLSCSGLANARDYLIEVVLFETVAGKDLTAGGLYYPRIEESLQLGSENAVAQGFLPLELDLKLSENAAAIAASSRYRLLRHLAWRQPGLADNDAIAVRVALGDTIPMFIPEDLTPYPAFYPGSLSPIPDRSKPISSSIVNGTIKVRLGRFLHMDTRLTFTDEKTSQSFKLAQSRKMRSGELHYIDNPRFGLLTQITPLDDEIGPASEPTIEPESVEEPTDETASAPE
ncbi:MAG: CsiV family protein [Granulosicoccus sp.]